MKLISEYKLDTDTIKMYRDKGFEIYYGYENPVIKKGEAVGILLDTMYKSTIELIEYLLFTKHKLTLKYEDTQYKLQSLDEWHRTYTENKRTMHYKHPLYIIYESKREDYLEEQIRIKNKEKQEELQLRYNIQDKPVDLDIFVDTFSRLYNINVDMSNDIDKMICYNQIKNYIDLGLPYASEDLTSCYTLEGQQLMYSNCIDIEESPFDISMFKEVSYQDNILVTTYGDETYLEDTIYKEVVE